MAGLTAAHALRSRGFNVTLLEKSRGAGGRMATRRFSGSRFDHGAQFFTVRDPRFAAAVKEWECAGSVAPWFTQDGHVRYRGTEGMNGIAKRLACDLDIRAETRVERIDSDGSGWRVLTSRGEMAADALIATPPAPQSLALCQTFLGQLSMEIPLILESISFDPCLAVMAILDGASRVPAPGFVRPLESPIAWIANNTQKGVSEGAPALTIHAGPEFSRANWDAPPEEIARRLLQAAASWIDGRIVETNVHRWRYSQPIATHTDPFLYTRRPAPLAFAGDAFGGPRIEGAFLSGLAAANIVADG